MDVQRAPQEVWLPGHTRPFIVQCIVFAQHAIEISECKRILCELNISDAMCSHHNISISAVLKDDYSGDWYHCGVRWMQPEHVRNPPIASGVAGRGPRPPDHPPPRPPAVYGVADEEL